MIHTPFKFLGSYTKDDSSIFFGRDQETKSQRSPLNPPDLPSGQALKGKTQRAVQKLSKPAGRPAPLGVRGSDGIEKTINYHTSNI